MATKKKNDLTKTSTPQGNTAQPSTTNGTELEATQPNPQSESLLFRRLPQEIRNRIYSELFFSTRFSSGISVRRPGNPPTEVFRFVKIMACAQWSRPFAHLSSS
jgi:hypothetical protein